MPRLKQARLTWSAVAERIAGSEGPMAWCWMASLDEHGAWVPLMWTVRGASTVVPRLHMYSDIAVACESLDPADAAERFAVGRIGALDQAPLVVELPTHELSPTWRTTQPAYHPIAVGPWPYLLLEHDLRRDVHISTWDELTASGEPFFVSAQAACAELLLGLPPEAAGNDTRGRLRLALPDRRAAIDRLSFADGLTRIPLRSARPHDLEGGVLRVSWRQTADAVAPDRVDVPLTPDAEREYTVATGGVPHEFTAIVVTADGTVLDRRGWQANYGDRPREAPTPDEEIEHWLAEGEGTHVEFKQQLGRENNDAFARDVCAFANTDGGVILIGVTDEGDVVGSAPPHDARMKDRITQVISRWVTPRPDYDIEPAEVRGQRIWIVRVTRGDDRPYEVLDVPYVRDNAISRPAKRDEQLSLVARTADALALSR